MERLRSRFLITIIRLNFHFKSVAIPIRIIRCARRSRFIAYDYATSYIVAMSLKVRTCIRCGAARLEYIEKTWSKSSRFFCATGSRTMCIYCTG